MAATEASATTGMCLERLERVAELCRSYVDRGYMSCTDILISRRGKRWLRSTHGLMDVAKGVPLRDDALFRIYSMTKPLTCIAAMICYERGNFAMDDPVGLHLPEFADMDVLVGSSDHATITSPLSAATPLTIAHCFTHTNGLGGPRPAGTKGSSDDGAAAAAPSSLAEAVARDSTRPLIFVPGTKVSCIPASVAAVRYLFSANHVWVEGDYAGSVRRSGNTVVGTMSLGA
jgi:CubicO group peptidase (beta-lactamase class C family)